MFPPPTGAFYGVAEYKKKRWMVAFTLELWHMVQQTSGRFLMRLNSMWQVWMSPTCWKLKAKTTTLDLTGAVALEAADLGSYGGIYGL